VQTTATKTFVVDSDSHVMEPADLWEKYIEPSYRDRAIRVVEVDGAEQLVMGDGKLLVAPGALAVLGGVNIEPRSRLFDGTLKYRDACPPASYDPAARVAMLDEWGVDMGVLFPTVGILWTPEDSGLASAHCRAYNNWQADFSADIKDRVIPIAQLNYLDVDDAIKELDRCLELGFRGVFAYPEPVGSRRPGHPDFDPIWRRCAEAGIPVCLHLVVRFGSQNPIGERWYGSKLESQVAPAEINRGSLLFGLTLNGAIQLMASITSMVADGLFDRVPELKVLCVESGAGWATKSTRTPTGEARLNSGPANTCSATSGSWRNPRNGRSAVSWSWSDENTFFGARTSLTSTRPLTRRPSSMSRLLVCPPRTASGFLGGTRSSSSVWAEPKDAPRHRRCDAQLDDGAESVLYFGKDLRREQLQFTADLLVSGVIRAIAENDIAHTDLGESP
jgi:predicted TIM-barrel fold metal-dependent hydrolase